MDFSENEKAQGITLYHIAIFHPMRYSSGVRGTSNAPVKILCQADDSWPHIPHVPEHAKGFAFGVIEGISAKNMEEN